MKKYSFMNRYIFLIFSCFLLISCGSSTTLSAPEHSADTALEEENIAYETTMSPDLAEGYAPDSNLPVDSMPTNTPSNQKIIRTASLSLEAEDVPALYSNILGYSTQVGGYLYSYEMQAYDESASISAVFKIPPQQLDSFINFIGETGTILHSSMNSDDVTEEFYDTTTRLQTTRKSLEQYYTLLATAQDIEQIVYIQGIIDDITEEIEAMEGRIKVLNSLADMATVNLTIQQVVIADVAQKPEIDWNALTFEDMGTIIRHFFISIVNFFIKIIQWISIILLGFAPLWILLAVCFFISKWIIKKKRKAKYQMSQELSNKSQEMHNNISESPDNINENAQEK